MEYVDGRTLADILRSNGHLTSKQAAEIASEVAAALGFAHAAGLVHRDIKPANILIGTNGSVKVADFGIARALNSPTESNLTQAGAVMGTATYFSPEQAQGAQPDPRSDLYSLGIVMYEMIAGRPPFTGDNPVSIAYKQVHDYPTPLNQLVADVPRAVRGDRRQAATKDPAVRYSTADALREDLRRFRNGERPVALQSAAGAQGDRRQTTAVMPGAAARPAGSECAPVRSGPAPPVAAQRPAAAARPDRRRGARRATASSRAPAGTPSPPSSPSSPSASAASCCSTPSPATTPPSSRQLPDYVGQQLSAVVADLANRDLTYVLVEEQNDRFDDGIVHRTDPGGRHGDARGRYACNCSSTRPTTRPLSPTSSGMTVDEARPGARGGRIPGGRHGDRAERRRAPRAGRAHRARRPARRSAVQETITLFVAGHDRGRAPTTRSTSRTSSRSRGERARN